MAAIRCGSFPPTIRAVSPRWTFPGDSSEVSPDLLTLDDPGLAIETERPTKLLPPNFPSDFQSVEPLGHLLPPQVALFFLL